MDRQSGLFGFAASALRIRDGGLNTCLEGPSGVQPSSCQGAYVRGRDPTPADSALNNPFRLAMISPCEKTKSPYEQAINPSLLRAAILELSVFR
jgi:hypothetical protein